MSEYNRITYCDVAECCEICPKYGDDCDGYHREVWEYDGFEYFGETEQSKRKLCCTCKHRTPHVTHDTCDIDGHVMGQFEILKRCCDRWEKDEACIHRRRMLREDGDTE